MKAIPLPLVLRLSAVAVVLLSGACSDDDPTGPGPVQGRQMYAVDGSNQLREIDSDNPDEERSTVAITGMASGETMVGIDFNAADGLLYGVGSAGNVYRVNLTSGLATRVGAGPVASLSGQFFGVDFNPVPNRLRIHSETGLNLRVDQTIGVLAATDVVLAFATADANAGATPNIVASAYTNSVTPAPMTTVLFAIDSDLDVLANFADPNTGQMTTVGSLGVDVGDAAGFDIAGDDGTAYAALTTGTSGSSLYTIDLASGQTTLIGSIGGEAIVGLAVAP